MQHYVLFFKCRIGVIFAFSILLKNKSENGNMKQVSNIKKIIIGEKFNNIKFDFRETCFGISENNGKLLLVKRKNQYSFAGGGIEQNESNEECLKREFLEESGYTIKSIKPLCIVDCYWLAGGDWPMESLANFFIVELDESVKVKECTEDSVAEFIDIDAAMDMLPLPYQKKALEVYLKEKNYKSQKLINYLARHQLYYLQRNNYIY